MGREGKVEDRMRGNEKEQELDKKGWARMGLEQDDGRDGRRGKGEIKKKNR